VPSLFRRRPADLVEPDTANAATTAAEQTEQTPRARTKRYTPSKRERGVITPKRSSAQRRRVPEPPPANRREAARRMRERRRAQRAETMEGMRRGDERYLLPRDRGPERALVRNIVDSRRTAGTWFFGGAVLVLVGSSVANPLVQLASNLLWLLLALAVVIDAVLISRRIKKLVFQRFPKTTQKPRSLYAYGIMRSLMFRRMRVPKPQVDIGETV
jgi:hypothetical protein